MSEKWKEKVRKIILHNFKSIFKNAEVFYRKQNILKQNTY